MTPVMASELLRGGVKREFSLAAPEENPQSTVPFAKKRLCGIVCENCKEKEAQVLELKTNQAFCNACHRKLKKESSSDRSVGNNANNSSGHSEEDTKLTAVQLPQELNQNRRPQQQQQQQDQKKPAAQQMSKENLPVFSYSSYNPLDVTDGVPTSSGLFSGGKSENAVETLSQRTSSSKYSGSSHTQFAGHGHLGGGYDPLRARHGFLGNQPGSPFDSAYARLGMTPKALISEGKGSSFADKQGQQGQQGQQARLPYNPGNCSLLPPLCPFSQSCTAIRHNDGTYEWMNPFRGFDGTYSKGNTNTSEESLATGSEANNSKSKQSKAARAASIHRKGAIARYKVSPQCTRRRWRLLQARLRVCVCSYTTTMNADPFSFSFAPRLQRPNRKRRKIENLQRRFGTRAARRGLTSAFAFAGALPKSPAPPRDPPPRDPPPGDRWFPLLAQSLGQEGGREDGLAARALAVLAVGDEHGVYGNLVGLVEYCGDDVPNDDTERHRHDLG